MLINNVVSCRMQGAVYKSGSAESAFPGFLEYEFIYATFPAAGIELGESEISLIIEIKYLGRGSNLEWIAPKPVDPVSEDRHPSL